MFENFYCSGEWWDPQNPEKRLPGILSYNNEKGFILKLLGALDNDSPNDNYKHPSIIIGLTKEHGEITLFRCILINQPSQGMRISGGFWSQITKSNYNPQYVFLGFCFQKKEEIQFKKVYITYTNFAEWVDISGFTLPRLPPDEPFNITYKKPDNIKIKLNDKCNLIIYFAFNYPTLHSVQKDVHCEQETRLLIEFDEMTKFEDFFEISQNFKNFLSFAIKQPVYIQKMSGISSHTYKKQNNEEINEDLSVEIMAKFFKKSQLPREILPPEMLFSYEDVSTIFDIILQNWFAKNEKFEPVFNLYFSTIHNDEILLENQFLNLMQAIEAYHRRAYENLVEEPDRYQRKIDGIVSAVSEANKKWLAQKLQYSNEKTLKTRFNEIFDKNARILNPFFNNGKNCKKFIQTAINTRNDYTHWDPTRKPVDFEKLFNLVIKLKLVLSICILTELELDDDMIEQFSKRLLSSTRYETLIEFD